METWSINMVRSAPGGTTNTGKGHQDPEFCGTSVISNISIHYKYIHAYEAPNKPHCTFLALHKNLYLQTDNNYPTHPIARFLQPLNQASHFSVISG